MPRQFTVRREVQSLKAILPMDMTDAGMVTEERSLQPLNDSWVISSMAEGISMFFSRLLEKLFFSILVTVPGKVMVSIFELLKQ